MSLSQKERHRILTPITLIRGYVDLLKKEERFAPDSLQYLQIISHQLDVLTDYFEVPNKK